MDPVPYVAVGCMVAAIAYAILRRTGTYDASRMHFQFVQVRRILLALAGGFTTVLVLGYAFKITGQFSRGWAVSWFGLAFVLLVLFHAAAASVLRRLVRQGRFGQHVAVIAERGYGEDVMSAIDRDPHAHLNARISFDPNVDGEGVLDEAALERFVDNLQHYNVDRVIIAVPPNRRSIVHFLNEKLRCVSAEVAMYDEILSRNATGVSVTQTSGMHLFTVQKKPLGPWSNLIKAGFDRFAAAALIAIFAIPMALIAFAIKRESPGPVLFVQRRHGFNHHVIHVLKFRTMFTIEDGADVVQATRDDARVTAVGRFLRRTSLDELPQLFNVLSGEMSLVGPRPHALAHNEQYTKMLEHYANRHRVRPGITGLAQINACRGGTQDSELMRRRVEYDLYYIDNWSFWLDLKILLLTPFCGLINPNAY
jgi:putative colanic acid biosynthesis UDP-glucose lipid carrier transferase